LSYFGLACSVKSLPWAYTPRLQPDAPNSGNCGQENHLLGLGSFFRLLALILCGLGIYSFLLYNVQYRTKEIGLRLSLGASRTSIISLVVRDALRWSGAGLIFGIPLAIPAMQLAAALMYGVRPIDIGTIAATIVTITFCAAFGCLRACVAGPKSQSRQNSQIPINPSMSLASIASMTDTRLRDAYLRAHAMPRQSVVGYFELVRLCGK
jgi:ABC-type antimicrobial peptide transport system permease subunit